MLTTSNGTTNKLYRPTPRSQNTKLEHWAMVLLDELIFKPPDITQCQMFLARRRRKARPHTSVPALTNLKSSFAGAPT